MWGVVLSVISVFMTVYDKLASKNRKNARVPEKVLFLLSMLGGSVAMYLTMLVIRHKTKHKRFMIGLPVIIIAQYGILLYFMNFAG